MQLNKKQLYRADLIAKFLDYCPCALEDILRAFRNKISIKDIKKILNFFEKHDYVSIKNNKYFINQECFDYEL